MVPLLESHNIGKGLSWEYMLRSFRIIQMFTDPKNFKIILGLKPDIFNLICKAIVHFSLVNLPLLLIHQ